MNTDALGLALARASGGLTWEYPCLIWIADYLRDATGRDPAAAWRAINWNEATARHELGRLAVAGEGRTAVERALDAIAKRDGWQAVDGPRQGSVMIGCYRSEDGIGIPAIFDGHRRWIVSNDGQGWASHSATPETMWEVTT